MCRMQKTNHYLIIKCKINIYLIIFILGLILTVAELIKYVFKLLISLILIHN
jgi:hypothetical protein